MACIYRVIHKAVVEAALYKVLVLIINNSMKIFFSDYDGKVSPLMLNTISSSGSYNKNYHFKKSAGSRGSSFDSSQHR